MQVILRNILLLWNRLSLTSEYFTLSLKIAVVLCRDSLIRNSPFQVECRNVSSSTDNPEDCYSSFTNIRTTASIVHGSTNMIDEI